MEKLKIKKHLNFNLNIGWCATQKIRIHSRSQRANQLCIKSPILQTSANPHEIQTIQLQTSARSHKIQKIIRHGLIDPAHINRSESKMSAKFRFYIYNLVENNVGDKLCLSREENMFFLLKNHVIRRVEIKKIFCLQHSGASDGEVDKRLVALRGHPWPQ